MKSCVQGRIVICGATGYVGNIPGGQSMAVFTSDDDGKTYQTSTGRGAATMPFKGLAECQIVEMNNGATEQHSGVSRLSFASALSA